MQNKLRGQLLYAEWCRNVFYKRKEIEELSAILGFHGHTLKLGPKGDSTSVSNSVV